MNSILARGLLFFGLMTFSIVGISQRLESETKRTLVITPELVTPEPIENASRLYQFLKDTYGRKIISGVMTLHSMDEVNWLKVNTGKEPALIGLDFMHSGREYDWYDDEEPIKDARTYYNRNGIPVICWHWRDPSRVTEEFYTDGTSFNINKVFEPESPEYQAMINDIDYISGMLKILNDENIPVIWRPLHEAAGGWFWWGAKGAAPCKKLFQVMYDRMVNHHGLKNLIWVWTREPKDDAWYPGDEYVDIVGRDIYKDGNHTSHIAEFLDMKARYGNQKMVTISECGSMPDVDNLMADDAAWLWYMPWYGKYTRDAQYNSLNLWKKMFAHSYVITLDEMPDLKTYEASVVTDAEDIVNQNQLSVFPTIVTEDQITVKSVGIIGALAIYNSIGQVVNNYEVNSDVATLRVQKTPGLYFVKRLSSTETIRFIVK